MIPSELLDSKWTVVSEQTSLQMFNVSWQGRIWTESLDAWNSVRNWYLIYNKLLSGETITCAHFGNLHFWQSTEITCIMIWNSAFEWVCFSPGFLEKTVRLLRSGRNSEREASMWRMKMIFTPWFVHFEGLGSHFFWQDSLICITKRVLWFETPLIGWIDHSLETTGSLRKSSLIWRRSSGKALEPGSFSKKNGNSSSFSSEEPYL